MEGQIVEGRGGLYTVRDFDGVCHVLRAKKTFRRMGVSPLVGDRVYFTPGNKDEHGWVDEILPRVSEFLRPPVANVRTLCIVLAPVPQPDWLLADKLLLAARMQGIRPVMVINKCDADEGALNDAVRMYAKADVQVLGVSARAGAGMEELRQALSGGLCCFSGQSGVGKSTLLSLLMGRTLETGALSEKIARGKQTTRHVSLMEENGLSVLDTPGFSLLEAPDDMEPSGLAQYYPEFAPYFGRCRFAPCFHLKEPGCAVLAAEKEGALDKDRLARYRELYAEIQTNWRERYD